LKRLAVVLLVAGCGDNLPAPAVDAAPPLSWGAPTPLCPASVADDDDPSLTADRLELVFNREEDVYTTTRASLFAPWSTPALVAELSTASFETTPEISGDGLTIYFASDRTGDLDIYVATRALRSAAWGTAMKIDTLDSTTADGAAYITADRLIAVIGTDRKANTDHDLYWSERTDPSVPWPAPVELAQLNSPVSDWSPMLSADKLTLLYVSRRESLGDPFGSPDPIEELNTDADEADPWLSPDGHHLVFTSDRAHTGVGSLYAVSR
jgi:hypothetical protein